jgi:(2Fe-2S) ferredoxin
MGYNELVGNYWMLPMSDSPKPRYRIVMCLGEHCNAGGRTDRLFERLNQAIEVLNAEFVMPRANLRPANCLDMCDDGPNLVIFPDNLKFHHIDSAEIERIIEDVLKLP